MLKTYDVIVAGGGPSGAIAAIAASRQGAKVLLIEKNGYLGGMNTAAMVCPLMTFHAGEKQIVKGIAEEIVQELISMNASLGHICDPLGVVSTITPIEPEVLKFVYFKILEKEENIEVLLHSVISAADCENGAVKSITVINKSGQSKFSAKTFIDATGDGDVAKFCKADYDEGRPGDGLSQPMTLMFKLGNVNFDKIYDYIDKNPEQFILNKDCDYRKYLAVSGFFNLVKQAKEKGDLNLSRDRVLFFQGINQGEIFVNMSRILKYKGTDTEDLTKSEMEAHKQITDIICFMKKYLPGFEETFLIQSASVTGVRESRRFQGNYTLTIDDVLGGKVHKDSVAVCAFPIDIHDPSGGNLNWVKQSVENCYDIPFRTMTPKKLKNLLVTGRCISATHEAMASSRITATAMALGEAAGIAAAIEAKNKMNFHEMDISLLQEKIKSSGGIYSKNLL